MGKIRKLLFWPLQVLPPLCLLPLARIPFDIVTVVVWGPAFFIGILSFVRLVKYLIKGPKPSGGGASSLTRPLLTIFILILAIISVNISLKSARAFTVQKAMEINKQCQNSKCPEHIDGWEERKDSFNSETMAGNQAKYRIMYSVSEDLNNFSLVLRINMDQFYSISGGTGKELSH